MTYTSHLYNILLSMHAGQGWLEHSRHLGGLQLHVIDEAKWLSSSNRRYFTIDFNSQMFFYSHTEDQRLAGLM